MSLTPTATAQDTSYSGDPGDGGRYFVATVTFNIVAVLANADPLTDLIGVANGLPVGTRIVGLIGWGGAAVVDGGAVGLLMTVRGANLEYRSNASMALTVPAATNAVICTFLCTR